MNESILKAYGNHSRGGWGSGCSENPGRDDNSADDIDEIKTDKR